jgi:hypothetical protein
MWKSNWVKMLTRLCMLTVLGASLWWQFSGRAKDLDPQNPKGAQNSISISTSQLPTVDGVVPVNLRCQIQNYLEPTDGKALRCIVKNNFNCAVTAFSLAYGITYEVNGKKSTDSSSLTTDALIHPDFHDSNFSKFTQPGAERDIQTIPVIAAPMSNIQITVGIDYVEFDNGTTFGPNANGSRSIAQIREGAAKYKAWLKRNYLARGNSMDAVKGLLDQTSTVATDLGIPDELEVGAQEYRRNARQVFNFRGGPSELEKHLKERP